MSTPLRGLLRGLSAIKNVTFGTEAGIYEAPFKWQVLALVLVAICKISKTIQSEISLISQTAILVLQLLYCSVKRIYCVLVLFWFKTHLFITIGISGGKHLMNLSSNQYLTPILHCSWVFCIAAVSLSQYQNISHFLPHKIKQESHVAVPKCFLKSLVLT